MPTHTPSVRRYLGTYLRIPARATRVPPSRFLHLRHTTSYKLGPRLIPHSLYIYKLPVTTMALANFKFATPPSNSLFRQNPSTTYPYNQP